MQQYLVKCSGGAKLETMAKKSKSELAENWAKKNNICGEKPWWDKDRMYYNLTVEQVLKMAKYIETKSKVLERS